MEPVKRRRRAQPHRPAAIFEDGGGVAHGAGGAVDVLGEKIRRAGQHQVGRHRLGHRRLGLALGVGRAASLLLRGGRQQVGRGGEPAQRLGVGRLQRVGHAGNAHARPLALAGPRPQQAHPPRLAGRKDRRRQPVRVGRAQQHREPPRRLDGDALDLLINISGVFQPADGQPPAPVEVVTLSIYAEPAMRNVKVPSSDSELFVYPTSRPACPGLPAKCRPSGKAQSSAR
jgi:hypothetical protein